MHRTNIYLEDSQVSALDAVARREGTTRAEVVRRLIDRGLAEDRSTVDRDLAVLREAFGALRGDLDDPVRADGARGEHLDVIWAS